jgi:hypothetical protein
VRAYIPLSDRERAEGFHLSITTAVATITSAVKTIATTVMIC